MTRPELATAGQWSQEHYEAIRLWSLARPRPNSAPSGAALLLRRGMAAWLLNGPVEALPSQFRVRFQSANGKSYDSSTRLSTQTYGERPVRLTLVLATMVEQAQGEVAR